MITVALSALANIANVANAATLTAAAATIDAAPIAAPITARRDGNLMYFHVSTDQNGVAVETSVLLDGAGNLQFFPERSAVQRALMERLGLI